MPSTSRRYLHLAIALWLIVLIVISLRVSTSASGSAGVFPIYRQAASHWFASRDLYALDDYQTAFCYSPIAAASFVPLALLPEKLAAILWRFFNTAVLLAGLFWWMRAVLPQKLTASQQAILFLVVLPFAAININNAQANTLLAGLILCATAAAASSRWLLTGVFLAAAILLKVFPIALALLLVLIFPRKLTLPLLLALAIGLLLPYALQKPAYINRQYSQWLAYLSAWDRHPAATLSQAYPNFRLLLTAWHLPVSETTFLISQLVAALTIAAVSLHARSADMELRRLLTMLSSLACSWMILWGSSTESCTYLLIAPALAWYLLATCNTPLASPGRLLVLAAALLLAITMIAGWFPFFATIHALGIHPLGALCLFLGILATEYGPNA